ncbi:MAG: MBL fold metallo-hydrolase [Candidatus Margulisiibacteriota bacterium]
MKWLGLLVLLVLVFMLLILYLGYHFSAPGYQGAVSYHFNGKTFENATPVRTRFLDVLKWKWTSSPQAWPQHVPLTFKPDIQYPIPSKAFRLTFINHDTFLIEADHLRILTDPIWSKRASPFSMLGPKRVHDPGLPFSELPPIDVVLISHNHYDHMDIQTLKALQKRCRPLFITGLGNKAFLIQQGLQNVVELDWWDSIQVKGWTLTFTPAKHFSSRGLFDRNQTLWGGFVAKSATGATLYFAGDTGFDPFFKAIATQLGPIDVALLPIGAYEPTWFMKPVHCNPAEAVQAHQLLGAKQSFGMHWGCFQLTDEAREQPLAELASALNQAHIPTAAFKVLQPGQTTLVPF